LCIWSNYEMFTGTTATVYNNCLDCLAPPPTPSPLFTLRKGNIEFSLSCPVCELTNGGTPKNFYTSFSSTTIQTGVYIYEDSTLQTPILANYLRYQGIIYSVDSEGRLTELCNQNGNC
jgi:hypothetical protein